LAKKKRIKRSRTDLIKELKDQIALLESACDTYDAGLKPVGKHIALSLRVLLHHRGQSQSLLRQLNLLSVRFFDTAGEVNPRNLATSSNLVATAISGNGAEYVPLVLSGGGPIPQRLIKFADWWNQVVVVDNQRREFKRRELIAHVADTDGGAHVDPELDEAYMDLSRNNSLGWVFRKGDIEQQLNGPELACMRQIAHEVLITLRQHVPECFIKKYKSNSGSS